MQQLIAFQSFTSVEEANEVAALLNNAGLETEVAKKTIGLDKVLVGNEYTPDYVLRIAEQDFARANKILYQGVHLDISEIDKDHPLLAMTSDELKEILVKPDEWGPENYNIALALLKHRGVTLPVDQVAPLKEERLELLAQRKSMHPMMILLGYLVSAMPIAIGFMNFQTFGYVYRFHWYPSAFGLVMGLVIVSSRTMLPNGEKEKTYTDNTIKHGIAITLISIAGWILNFIFFSAVSI